MNADLNTCVVCGAPALDAVIRIDAVPVYCNVLWPTPEAARAAERGDIDLVFCRACGHLFNRAFDARLTEYSPDYDNSLHFSARFNAYAEALAQRLVTRYGLHDRHVVELGCGKGDFLAMLCRAGHNRGTGFDRSYDPSRHADAAALGAEITFIQDFYSERYAGLEADLLCCRHVLEHLDDPRGFLRGVRQTLAPSAGTVLYFEVPNARFTLQELGIWDLIYEHCSYFTLESLVRLFTDTGFAVLDQGEAFAGQFLAIEARRGAEGADQTASPVGVQAVEDDSRAALAAAVQAFEQRYHDKIQEWRTRLDNFRATGRQVVAWGAGSKGVTFLNLVDADRTLTGIVDLNPHKQGQYVAGVGTPVMGPRDLISVRPDEVIVMNPIYIDEIRQQLADLGVVAEVRAV